MEMGKAQNAFEVNFDGLVGPTHHYGGLSFGNIASTTNKGIVANPREAALQGLSKMRFLSSLGIPQAVLPPQERPDMNILRVLGFRGSDQEILNKVLVEFPEILSPLNSSSSMWTANAATVSPSMDTEDGKVHFTPANLIHKFHRSLEWPLTGKVLRAIFSDPKYFVHHPPLPSHEIFGDEGAANHSRFAPEYGREGIHFFVYGRCAFSSQQRSQSPTKIFPARQTYEASLAVTRAHGLNPERIVFAQQNPQAIDAGAFHNDVVAVGNLGFFLYHEEAYIQPEETLNKLASLYQKIYNLPFGSLKVPSHKVSLTEAISTYLFNCQMVRGPQGHMELIAPRECQENSRVHDFLLSAESDPNCPIGKVHFFDLRQSMRNGGGPACLRLRVVLRPEELKNTLPGVFLTEKLYQDLCQWVQKHYRDRLQAEDLADPQLVRESQEALDELASHLGLGSIYSFQQ